MLLCLLRKLGLFNAPIVHHQHGSENPLTYATFRFGRMLFLPRLYNAMLKRLHLSADHIIVIDKKCLNMNIRWGVPENRLTLLPNAVDTEIYKPSPEARHSFRQRWRIPENAFLFAFAGRLEEVKRIHLILEALCLMEAGSWLVVAGDGSLRPELEEYASSSSAADHIRFTGPLDSDEMPSLYASADCLVLPSAAEGVPLVILESMATGIPVVATQVGGVADLLDPVSGMILSANLSARDLAEAMDLSRKKEWDSKEIRAGAQAHSSLRAVSVLDGVFADVTGKACSGR